MQRLFILVVLTALPLLSQAQNTYCDGHYKGYINTWLDVTGEKPRYPGCSGNRASKGTKTVEQGFMDGAKAADKDLKQANKKQTKKKS